MSGTKIVLIALLLALPGVASAQDTPSWVSATPVVTADGFATLQWSMNGDQSISAFRIHEQAPDEQQFLYTDQVEIRLFRKLPGDYRFRVQACIRSPSDYPRCGAPSQPLTLIVQNPSPTQQTALDEPHEP